MVKTTKIRGEKEKAKREGATFYHETIKTGGWQNQKG
jgi:hypothetical protein